MTLPRFSGGRLGPATSGDMNRVMAAAERVEAMPKGPAAKPAGEQVIFAQLLSEATGQSWENGYKFFDWAEVAAWHTEPNAPWKWKPYAGGLSSTQFIGGPAYAVSLGGAAVGDIVELRRLPVVHGDFGPIGRTWFFVVPLSTAVTVASGRIVSERNNVGVLGLDGYNVQLFAASGGWDTPNGETVFAVNMFEQASGVLAQVDSESPGTKTLLRLPFNTPVGPLHKLPIPYALPENPPIWSFTFPNAFEVVC